MLDTAVNSSSSYPPNLGHNIILENLVFYSQPAYDLPILARSPLQVSKHIRASKSRLRKKRRSETETKNILITKSCLKLVSFVHFIDLYLFLNVQKIFISTI